MGSGGAAAKAAGLRAFDEVESPEGDGEADEERPTPIRSKLSRKKIDQLILEHREHGKRLAWSFLSSWRVRMGQDEVLSVVGAALCEAANRFDPSRDVAFKTFFFYHLRGMLLKEIARVIQEQKVLQFMPTGLGADALRSEQYIPGNWSLQLVENNNPERIIEKRQVASACWEACAQLDTLEQEVLVRYFVYDEPLVQIAKELDYCRCHISRVKSRALNKLSRLLKNSAVLVERARLAAQVEVDEEEETEGSLDDLALAPARGRSAAQRKNYTGGRGRRKQKKSVPKRSDALQKILQEAY